MSWCFVHPAGGHAAPGLDAEGGARWPASRPGRSRGILGAECRADEGRRRLTSRGAAHDGVVIRIMTQTRTPEDP